MWYLTPPSRRYTPTMAQLRLLPSGKCNAGSKGVSHQCPTIQWAAIRNKNQSSSVQRTQKRCKKSHQTRQTLKVMNQVAKQALRWVTHQEIQREVGHLATSTKMKPELQREKVHLDRAHTLPIPSKNPLRTILAPGGVGVVTKGPGNPSDTVKSTPCR